MLHEYLRTSAARLSASWTAPLRSPQCGQHGDRESTELAFSIGTFFAPY
jgi:hypothetical protein